MLCFLHFPLAKFGHRQEVTKIDHDFSHVRPQHLYHGLLR